MKKLLPSLMMFIALGFVGSSFGQTTLWLGEPSWSGGASNIYGYDTSTYTLTTTLALSSDATASVQGVHGLSLNPDNGMMYILYQDPSSGAAARRLGTVDLTTGAITDIGNVGNVRDIEFQGSTLYGVGGRQDGTAEYYEIDITDATTSAVGNFSAPFSGVAITNNIYAEEMYFWDQSTNFGVIDPSGTETSLWSPFSSTRAMAFKNDSIVLFANGTNIQEFNFLSNTIGPTLFSHPASMVHSMAFDQYPLSVLVNGPSTFCSTDPSEIYINEIGGTYQWLVDGTEIPGATDSTHFPTLSGEYTCVLDGTDTAFSVQILVLPSPGANFSYSPDPVSLGMDPSGTVDFTNTSVPDGTDFWWDFSGFNTTAEEPTFAFPTAGSYDITFVVYDSLTGCSDTTMQTLTVIDDVSVGEIDADVSIYPIPTENLVTVSLLNATGDHAIQLTDLQGRVITEQSIVAGANTQATFDLTDFESGVYLIKVSDLETESFYKIVKK